MPAIVALVAANFPSERRAAAYGLVAAAGAIAVAAGPLIGGAVTTFASWRWVFVGEAVIVVAILLALRKVDDAPPAVRARFDVLGALLSIAGLSLLVYGVLKSGTWGFVKPKPSGPHWLGLSPVVWLVIGGLLVIYGFFLREAHVEQRGGDPLIRPSMLCNSQLADGLSMFFFQFFIISAEVKTRATTQLTAGVPFVSDSDLTAQLRQSDLPPAQVDAVVAANSDARLRALRTSLLVVALIAVAAMFCTGMIPVKPPGAGISRESSPCRAETPLR